MKMSTLQKLGGFSIITGAILLAIWTICFSFILPVNERFRDYSLMILNPNWNWIILISFFGIIFLIFGFISAYARMYEKSGIIGLLGFIFLILAYIFQLAHITWELFIFPVLAGNSSTLFMMKENILNSTLQDKVFSLTGDVSILTGIVLFFISILKSRIFSMLSGMLFIIGAVLYAVGPFINIYIGIIGVIIFATGCMLIGLRMFSIKTGTVVL